MRALIGVLSIGLSLAGCASTAPPAAGSGSPAARSAIEELVREASVPESEVTIVSESDVDWPDGCLGCAKTGEMCTQAITPGSRVVLLARGVTYEYHTSRAGAVRRCR